MKRIAVATTTLALAATGLGAGIAAAHGSGAAKATVLPVRLDEFHIVTKKVVPAGRVTFAVRNTGRIVHEMVVIRTPKRASRLLAGVAASEKGAIGEVADLQAGKSRTLTLTLTPGHYALICNLPGHYKAGMFMDFVVR